MSWLYPTAHWIPNCSPLVVCRVLEGLYRQTIRKSQNLCKVSRSESPIYDILLYVTRVFGNHSRIQSLHRFCSTSIDTVTKETAAATITMYIDLATSVSALLGTSLLLFFATSPKQTIGNEHSEDESQLKGFLKYSSYHRKKFLNSTSTKPPIDSWIVPSLFSYKRKPIKGHDKGHAALLEATQEPGDLLLTFHHAHTLRLT